MSTLSELPSLRYIVVTVGTAGDVYPFLSLALGLKKRGHQVSFVTNTVLAPMAEALGLQAFGTGTAQEYHDMLDDPDLWHPRKSLGVLQRGFVAGCREADDMPEYGPGASPCMVIAHPMAFGIVAAFRQQWPAMRVVVAHLAPSSLRSCDNPMQFGPFAIPAWFPETWRNWLWRQFDQPVDEAMLPALNTLRERWGQPAVPHLFEHIYQDADHTLCLFPTWFCPPLAGWPTRLNMGDFQRFDPKPQAALAAELVQFLRSGAAPVVFTPGSAHRHAQVYFRRALQAVQRLGLRAIFLTSHVDHVPADLPASVLWQAYVPLKTLLPQVAALVHHGGIGTTAEALAAGTPQLVLPLAFDQFDNAQRVRRLGVGDFVQAPFWWPSLGVTAGVLTQRLRALLRSDTIKSRCQEVTTQWFSDQPRNEETLQVLEVMHPKLQHERPPHE